MMTGSVLVCLITATRREAPFFRLALPASAETGLREPSQVMVGKVMAVRRDRSSEPIGRVEAATMLAPGCLLAFVVGVAD